MHHNPSFNLVILHNNLFDNQGIYILYMMYIYVVLICKKQQLASFHVAVKYIKQTVFKYICQIFIMPSTVFISPVHLGSKN